MLSPIAADHAESPRDFQIAGYFSFAVLTAYTWDWILSIPQECEILQKAKFNRPLGVYYLSRLSSQAYCFTECIEYVHPSISAVNMDWAKFLLWWLSGTFTSLLFLFRIIAVYPRSKAVKYCFTLLWLCWLLAPVVILFGSGSSCKSGKAFRLSPSHQWTGYSSGQAYCNAWSPLSGISVLTVLLNDTLVFLAISYRMVMNAVTGETWRERSRSFITGDGLYRISKALLHSGQLYYG
ncbi:hypothetical protein HWV62_40784 [Athelia sp. TMB]|nr:hypothetical protein HWV62_40784 [Athelia sp. TMB]